MHRSAPEAEAHVRALFEALAAERWLEDHVPHGFTLLGTTSEHHESRLHLTHPHDLVTATLKVPVVFARATPAAPPHVDRQNLVNLHALAHSRAHKLEAPEIEIEHWAITPEADPEPPSGPGVPDPEWTVTADFRVS